MAEAARPTFRALFQRRYTRAGAPPGDFQVHRDAYPTRARAMVFDERTLEERDVAAAEELAPLLEGERWLWLDVHGLGDGELVSGLGRALGIHPLALADVVHVGQRPKAEVYGDDLFVVLRMVSIDAGDEIHWEQVSLFLSGRCVVSFQERPGDCLDPLRERLREGRRLIRVTGAAYLACMIVDAIVDGYFPVLDLYAEQLEELEEDLFERPREEILAESYRVRRELAVFQRAIVPLREALGILQRDPDSPLPDSVGPYLRDVVDHVNQIGDVVESYRELAANVAFAYQTNVSHRTNEIVRTLTIVSTIFIPLTFLAGVYGMNFDRDHAANMPELGWRWGYPAFWAVALAMALVLLVLFRRAGWLGRR